MPRIRPALALLACLSAGLAWSGSASAMSYALVTLNDGRCAPRCPQAIFASGEIELNETQRLAAFVGGIAGPSLPRNLLVHSPGGNLAGALTLGFGLRRLGVNIIVARVGETEGGAVGVGPGRCASACVFVLMGGRGRLVPEGSRIFVHSPRNAGISQRDIVGSGLIDRQVRTDNVVALLQDYTRQMGVDPAVVALSYSVPNESARELTRAEIARFRLATGSAGRRRR